MSHSNKIPQQIEAQAVAEQILITLEKESTKLLGLKDSNRFTPIIANLGRLTSMIHQMNLSENFFQPNFESLKNFAEETELLIDDISEKHWIPIPISLGHHINRLIEASTALPPQKGLEGELRSHFYIQRTRLLEQTKGSRMHENSNDMGEDTERTFQQFFQHQLGSSYRVLRGGKIYGYDGNSSGQIDVIVVRSDSTIIIPSNAEGGKANVFIDEVLAAIMITGNLTKKKLRDDWISLQKIPPHPKLKEEFDQLQEHPWPLCYIVGGRGDPIENLESAWVEICEDGLKRHIPQFVLSLDSGYIYSGSRRRPCPRYPGNYQQPEQVANQDGIYGGLGLGWILLQIRARLAVLEKRPLGSLNRQENLMNAAMYSVAGRQSYYDRFRRPFTAHTQIFGSVYWGGTSIDCHNRLPAYSVKTSEYDLYEGGLSPQNLSLSEMFNKTRFFRYPVFEIGNGMVALQECFSAHDKENFYSRFVVFLENGHELNSALFRDAVSLSEALEIAERTLTETDRG
jgi:hypothetical protein